MEHHIYICHSLAGKYECDFEDIIYTSASTQFSLPAILINGALVTPTPGLLWYIYLQGGSSGHGHASPTSEEPMTRKGKEKWIPWGS